MIWTKMLQSYYMSTRCNHEYSYNDNSLYCREPLGNLLERIHNLYIWVIPEVTFPNKVPFM